MPSFSVQWPLILLRKLWKTNLDFYQFFSTNLLNFYSSQVYFCYARWGSGHCGHWNDACSNIITQILSLDICILISNTRFCIMIYILSLASPCPLLWLYIRIGVQYIGGRLAGANLCTPNKCLWYHTTIWLHISLGSYGNFLSSYILGGTAKCHCWLSITIWEGHRDSSSSIEREKNIKE